MQYQPRHLPSVFSLLCLLDYISVLYEYYV